MDYDSLRQEGFRQLEVLTGDGEQWTDFNEHDPGITILEQVCYALTDLLYRTRYDIPNLLATGGGDPYASLYPPAAVLSSRAVTSEDLRKVALDERDVHDAWVTRASDVRPRRSPVIAPPYLLGLHRVLIDADPDPIQDRVATARVVAGAVAARLHENRNVGEDFAEVRVAELQKITVECTVEIGPVDDAAVVRGQILLRLAEHIAPSIGFATVEQWWSEERTADEIFDGPLLDRRFGQERFIDSDALRATERPAAVYTAKVIRVISDVPHVRAVTDIKVSSEGVASDNWVLRLDPARCARLDWETSRVQLTRQGHPVSMNSGLAALRSARHAEAPRGQSPFAPPPYRDRHVRRYRPVQEQFPGVYGLGEAALPDGAPPGRRAQARQLMAYLLFFDQPMANYLAQLGQVRNLLGFEADPQTYFEQRVDVPGAPPPPPLDKPTPARRNRFLDHLLARFAEQLMDDNLMPGAHDTPDRPAQNKVAFLKAYPRVSGARGTAFDAMKPPGPDNRSGLEDRVALKLGLDAETRDGLVLVEHILLRHFTGVITPFELPDVADPFSLQVTFVLRSDRAPFRSEEFRAFTEQTLRQETPAHLVVYVQWFEGDEEWAAFLAAREAWLAARRELGPFQPDPPSASTPPGG